MYKLVCGLCRGVFYRVSDRYRNKKNVDSFHPFQTLRHLLNWFLVDNIYTFIA